MSVFADSSALVKLYADEVGHEVIRAIRTQLIVSQLARVEVPSAIWRKQRMRHLPAEDAALLVSEFEFDLFGSDNEAPRFVMVMPTPAVLDDAARLAAVHGLRAYDAIQLASARIARTAAAECNTVAAFDRDLRRAAASEAFSLVPGAI